MKRTKVYAKDLKPGDEIYLYQNDDEKLLCVAMPAGMGLGRVSLEKNSVRFLSTDWPYWKEESEEELLLKKTDKTVSYYLEIDQTFTSAYGIFISVELSIINPPLYKVRGWYAGITGNITRYEGTDKAKAISEYLAMKEEYSKK